MVSNDHKLKAATGETREACSARDESGINCVIVKSFCVKGNSNSSDHIHTCDKLALALF